MKPSVSFKIYDLRWEQKNIFWMDPKSKSRWFIPYLSSFKIRIFV